MFYTTRISLCRGADCLEMSSVGNCPNPRDYAVVYGGASQLHKNKNIQFLEIDITLTSLVNQRSGEYLFYHLFFYAFLSNAKFSLFLRPTQKSFT